MKVDQAGGIVHIGFSVGEAPQLGPQLLGETLDLPTVSASEHLHLVVGDGHGVSKGGAQPWLEP